MTGPEVRHVSVTVHRSAEDVYEFAADPENLRLWASGLGSEPRQVADAEWEVRSPEGPARIRFAPRNPFGVLDHTVMLCQGAAIYVPMRVVANGPGAEVILTLFRRPGMTDEAFTADATWVARDLATLKGVLERKAYGEEGN